MFPFYCHNLYCHNLYCHNLYSHNSVPENDPTSSLSVSEMSGGLVTTMPVLVVTLGFLGILPFLLALVWPSLLVFKIYSLAILAFLAGNWWSTALLVRSQSLVQLTFVILFSNLVVLIAVAAVFVEHSVGLFVLALLYFLLLVGERQLPVFVKQPKYYAAMRLGVSTVVVFLHLLAAWLL